jgi:HPt (histidine-containing phosphotransfer) domain-containing protein
MMPNNLLYNLDQLHDLSEGNQLFIDKMMALFIELMPQIISELGIGLKEQNYQRIHAAAHKAKPSIDMMGINSLKDTIRDLEKNALKDQNVDQIKPLIEKVSKIIEQVLIQLRSR